MLGRRIKSLIRRKLDTSEPLGEAMRLISTSVMKKAYSGFKIWAKRNAYYRVKWNLWKSAGQAISFSVSRVTPKISTSTAAVSK